jgi:acyl dehydratase
VEHDYNPIHLDVHAARRIGLEREVVQGTLRETWVVSALTGWLGDERGGFQVACRHLAPLYVDEPVMLVGHVEQLDGTAALVVELVTSDGVVVTTARTDAAPVQA